MVLPLKKTFFYVCLPLDERGLGWSFRLIFLLFLNVFSYMYSRVFRCHIKISNWYKVALLCSVPWTKKNFVMVKSLWWFRRRLSKQKIILYFFFFILFMHLLVYRPLSCAKGIIKGVWHILLIIYNLYKLSSYSSFCLFFGHHNIYEWFAH